MFSFLKKNKNDISTDESVEDVRLEEAPIRFIGVGESIDDLRPFNSKEFVKALISRLISRDKNDS